MRRITLAGLLKIELPGHTVLLSDGGTVTFNGDTYTSKDTLFGTLTAVEPFSNGVGDAAPSAKLTFIPDPDADAKDLNDPAFQGSRLRCWIVEIDKDTGLVADNPEPEADMIIDVPRLRFPKEGRRLEMDSVSAWVRLLDVNEGNVLNDGAHERVFPGELGLVNAVGVSTTVAWGTKSAPRGLAGVIAGIVGVGGGTNSGTGGGGGGGATGRVSYD